MVGLVVDIGPISTRFGPNMWPECRGRFLANAIMITNICRGKWMADGENVWSMLKNLMGKGPESV